jgi:hypothetical protein
MVMTQGKRNGDREFGIVKNDSDGRRDERVLN